MDLNTRKDLRRPVTKEILNLTDLEFLMSAVKDHTNTSSIMASTDFK